MVADSRVKKPAVCWLVLSAIVLLGACSASDEPEITANDPDTRARIQATLERARDGDAEARNTMGNAYATGGGLKQNDALAYQWFAKAAKQGYAIAQYNV